MPLMKPIFAAMVIFIGMTSWNNFLWPLLVLSDSKMFTLPIGLTSLMSPYGNKSKLLIFGAVMSVIPIDVFFQRAEILY